MPISDDALARMRERLASNKPVRRVVAAGIRLNIDRQLPFLCVYRQPTARDDGGTLRLITGEAAYLTGSTGKKQSNDLKRITAMVAETMSSVFGAFLLVEVWASTPDDEIEVEEHQFVPRPAVRINSAKGEPSTGVVDQLVQQLRNIRYLKQPVIVEEMSGRRISAWRRRPLLSAAEAGRLNCVRIGIEVKPYYRDSQSGVVFPAVLNSFRRGFGRALKHAFFDFTHKQTPLRPPSFHALGRRAMAKAVWEVDLHLAEIAASFDFLLQLNPVNAAELWPAFERRSEKAPLLRYRPLPIDPPLVKRRLYSIPIERIEDPAVALLMREKQTEIDRQLTMLMDRGSKRFMLGSLQLFGGVDPALLRRAEDVLERFPAQTMRERGRVVSTAEFCRLAEAEIAHYRKLDDSFTATVVVRDDVLSGIMVSNGNLMISHDYKTVASRVDALLQHEVGTHLVTFYNGRAQRFKQLSTGLAGYDPLQEGLAVLSEYLAGGMSGVRLRLLAGRVIAVHALVQQASFVDTYRLLLRYGFEHRSAFLTTMRVFRGGGLTKDASYLAGLQTVLDYLSKDGDLEPLLVGKIASRHIPLVRELQWRKVVIPPRFRPRYLTSARSVSRLDEVRRGLAVHELVERTAK